MKFLLLFLLSTQLTVSGAEGIKTHLLVMGGSGDPAGDHTIFDTSFSEIGDYYQSKVARGESGQTSVAFNGGHQKTDALKLKFENSGHLSNFTVNSYQAEINRYKKMMEDGHTIKRGEQLLIYINTHGAEKDEYNKTHAIAVGNNSITNYDSGSGTTLVSLDALEDLKNIAKKKGVKLGIVDLSCHAGNSQVLADENTCVVMATGKNHYGYSGSGFSGSFSKNVKVGENLESAFLKTRIEDTEPDFPLISTNEGKLIEDKIYFLLTPYLNYGGGGADKFTPELIRAATETGYSCGKNFYFEGLMQTLDQIEKTATASKKIFASDLSANKESITDFAELKRYLQEYKELQDLLTKKIKALNDKNMQKIEVIDSANKYTWAELIKTDWESLISNDQKQLKKKVLSSNERADYKNNISVYQKANIAKVKVMQENSRLSAYQVLVKEYEHGTYRTLNLARKIAALEKRLFNGLYKKYAKENNKSNPCREFKL